MYLNRIRDIPPGGIWIDRATGEIVTVREAAQGYVVFANAGGRVEPAIAEHAFRARYIAPYDRSALRSQFQMCLSNLGSFRVLWSHAQRRMFARSETATRQFSVPDDAQYIGTYTKPCSIDDFFGDLNDAIAERTAAAAATG